MIRITIPIALIKVEGGFILVDAPKARVHCTVHISGVHFYMRVRASKISNHIMNLLWLLRDRGTCVRFCWIPSHGGIEGNERMDQLAKQTLDQDIYPLANVHYTNLKPLVNSYLQQLVQTKWDVAEHGRDLYLVKATLGPPKKFQHLTRAEEAVITRRRI